MTGMMTRRGLCSGLLTAVLVGTAMAASPDVEHFQAHHEATIKEIPTGTHRARIWLVVPREDPAQKIGSIRLSGPGKSRVQRGGTYNNRYAYFEVENPGPAVTVSADFPVERHESHTLINLAAVQPLTEADRLSMARELEGNHYVPVNEKYRTLARKIVGDERNTVLQARKLYDWVLDNVEYWVKDPKNLKASANGESDYCLATKTGNCTDFHSLYASLARSTGIPVRMVYGSFFQGENTPLPNKASLDGKDTDASYHCWLQFYAKGIGWVPLDVAIADLLPSKGQQEYYFGNLDARRVAWSYGRDLTLAPKQDAGPVNAMHKVYVELDGKPYTTWERKFTYRSGK